ncbi:MAG: AAA family ATPase [Myxococcales bacterium]|nr:AAA family ATPase [Myxococcales bacterium]
MLRSLTVSNYRSLGDSVRVELGRLTALVGPNGSGKSNVMDALRFVSDAMHMGLSGAITDRSGIKAVRRWSGGHPFDLKVHLELDLDDGAAGYYGFVLTGARDDEYHVKSETLAIADRDHHGVTFEVEEGQWKAGPTDIRPMLDRQSLALPLVGGDQRFSRIVQHLQAISVYSIFPDTLRVPQRYSPRKPMARHGENWVSILRDQPAETWKPELISVLQRLTGDIEDIRIEPVAGYLVVRFRHRSENENAKWFEAGQESDGTLRVAGLVSALLQSPAVPVIGIEEPELTVHPGAIALLYDHLIQATEQSQVIITSHSPEMLDHFPVDDVRVVERHNGTTSVRPMASHQKEVVRNRLLRAPGDALVGGDPQLVAVEATAPALEEPPPSQGTGERCELRSRPARCRRAPHPAR